LALDYQRRNCGELDADWESPLPHPEAVAVGCDALMRFDRLLSALPPSNRNLFVRCRIEGMGYPSLAKDERLPPIRVERIVQQAFKTLRPLVLGSRGFLPPPSQTAFLLYSAQSSSFNPSIHSNALRLWVTRVAFWARAWQTIQRSLLPIGVTAVLSKVNCVA